VRAIRDAALSEDRSGIDDRAASRGMHPRLAAGLSTGSLAVLFFGLAWWSWGKWTDVHIDFGSELYIPWRISEGEALYRDIAHKNGPLAHYVNAGWFRLFGVSIRTLVIANLGVLAAICAIVFRIFRDGCDRFTAWLTCAVLLCVFAFAQYTTIANFNYVTPYMHHQTHGLLGSLATVLCFSIALRGRRLRWCALGGLCLGATLLTKAELAVPAAAVAVLGTGLFAATGPRRPLPVWATVVAAALLPAAVFLVFLGAQMPLPVALRGVLGNFAHLDPGLLGDRFYARGAGLDDLPANAWATLRMFGGLSLCVVAAMLADREIRVGRRRTAAAIALGAVCFAALVWQREAIPFTRLARALPITSAVLAGYLTLEALRARRDPSALARVAPLALWAVLALGFLGKMILNARFEQYGFVLAMPATLLLVAGVSWGLPRWLRASPNRGDLARALAVAGVAAFTVQLFSWTERAYARKDFVVGAGPDAIVAENPRFSTRPRVIEQTLRSLREIMPEGSTLLVLPQGVIVNYWLRARNPTPYTIFVPAQIPAYGGEQAILATLRARPPDFVALIHRPHAEYGVGPFGVDPRNGRRIMDWVRSDYERVKRIGAEPFTEGRFGAVILRRRGAGDRETGTLETGARRAGAQISESQGDALRALR
jgi:hypothetical protein